MIFIFIFYTAFCTQVLEPNDKGYRLLIDNTDVGIGKIYLAKITNDAIEVKDLFKDKSIKWIVINENGDAVCSVTTDGKKQIIKLNVLANFNEAKIIDNINFPDKVDGQLSRDGKKLCYLKEDKEKNKIEIINLDTGKVEEVFATDGPLSLPSWSPDEQTIAYYVGTPQSLSDDSFKVGISTWNGKVWEHKIIASPSKITTRNPRRERAPKWAADGESIIFEARYKDDERGTQTYIVNKEGNNLTWIADTAGSAFCNEDKIIYSLREKGIYIRDLDTGKTIEISSDKNTYCPRLSPKGDLIAYSTIDRVIFVMNSDGSNPRKIIDAKGPTATWRIYWVREP
jgi:hypothetical protein